MIKTLEKINKGDWSVSCDPFSPNLYFDGKRDSLKRFVPSLSQKVETDNSRSNFAKYFDGNLQT